MILGIPVNPASRFGLTYTPYKGSQQRPCSRCGELLWIGPCCCTLADQSGMAVVCTSCALKAGVRPEALVTLTQKGAGE